MLYYIYFAVLGISYICSLIHFRLHVFHLKILSIVVGIAFLTEFLAVPASHYFHFRNNNNPIYNIYILFEGCMYAYYYKLTIPVKWFQNSVLVFLFIFPLAWLITTFFVFGFTHWNSYMAVGESFFVVCFSGVYYYQLFTSENLVKLLTHPEFWIATAMILFYTCNLPYLGMLDYLLKNYTALSKVLLNVLQVLNIIMYSLFSYAFLCQTITKRY
jgi:hypothetical protein